MSSRARSSTAGLSSATAVQLPRYEPPTHPLNEAGQRVLHNLLAQQHQRNLQQHLRQAGEILADSGGLINERLSTLQESSKKRKVRQEDETDEQREEHLEELQRSVENMTKRMEEAIRKTIDGQEAATALEETVLYVKQQAAINGTQHLPTQTQASSQRRLRSRHADVDDASQFDPTLPDATQDSHTDVPVVVPSTLFQQRVQAERERWQALSHSTRYSENNAYVGFKKQVHESSYPIDQAPPLPPRETWFPGSGGAPAPGTTGGGAEDDSDDDIAIAMERISTKCPLTLQEFREPVMSRKCPHSFEKEAIVGLIRQSEMRTGGGSGRRGGEKTVQCPVTGCSEHLTESTLYPNAALIRKIRRIQRHRESEAAYASDSDSRAHSPSQRQRQRPESVASDSGEDIDAIERRQKLGMQTQLQRVKRERSTVTPGGWRGGGGGGASGSDGGGAVDSSGIVDLGSESDE